jgi:hypothetical protein
MGEWQNYKFGYLGERKQEEVPDDSFKQQYRTY